PGSGSCRIAAAIDGGVTVNSITYVDPTHVSLNISTVGATVGSRTVTITNPDGQTSSAAVFSVASVPANTALPTITGTDAVGSTLSEGDGTWTGFPAPAFTRQWERCDQAGANCGDIAAATGTSYTLVQADAGTTIRVRVTGTNGGGASSAESGQTAVVTGPPVNAVAPTASGTTNVGDTLAAGNGTWTGYPTPTFTYQWKRCDSDGLNCTAIGGATASTYVIALADQGYRLV